MPVRSYTKSREYAGGDPYKVVTVQCEEEKSSWNNSTRVGGKLVKRPQSCLMKKAVTTRFWLGYDGAVSVLPATAANIDFIARPPSLSASFDSLSNQALAKFNGKLRKGSASLGVTAASWKQSRDMIINRSRHMQRTVDSAYNGLLGNKKALTRLKKEREPLANQVLETEFGWMPLIQDVQASLYTACIFKQAEYITSRARGIIDEQVDLSTSGKFELKRWQGRLCVTYNARVVVTNPNLWLLNRLGLLNPAAVAWDLIPWSFVVNMVSNMNQLVNSFTDEIGLSVTDRNTTYSQVFLLTHSCSARGYAPGTPHFAAFDGGVRYREKSRVLNGSPPLTFELRVPKVDWELAVIATSLLVQKVSRLNKLIRAI